MEMLYVMALFLCELSSCPISFVSCSLALYPLTASVSSGSAGSVSALGTRLTLHHSRSNRHPSLNHETAGSEEKRWEGDLIVFLSRPKMADARDAILCFLVVFWGAESQPRIQSEAAGGSHICRHLCVYLHLRSSSQPTQG